MDFCHFTYPWSILEKVKNSALYPSEWDGKNTMHTLDNVKNLYRKFDHSNET